MTRRTAIAGTQSRIGARIGNTAGQTVANGVNTDRVFNVVTYDTDNMANLAADDRILTVNSAGTYLIISETNWAANATGRRITTIIINGFYAAGSGTRISADSRMAITTAGSRSVATSVAVYALAVGDFISAGSFQASGASLAEGGASAYDASALVAARFSA